MCTKGLCILTPLHPSASIAVTWSPPGCFQDTALPLHCTSDSIHKDRGELEVVRARLAEKEAVIEQLQQQLVQGLNDLKDTQVWSDVKSWGCEIGVTVGSKLSQLHSCVPPLLCFIHIAIEIKNIPYLSLAVCAPGWPLRRPFCSLLCSLLPPLMCGTLTNRRSQRPVRPWRP